MLGFSLALGFISIFLSILVVAVPLFIILEFFGLTDFLEDPNSNPDSNPDYIKECKREHPSNFKG